MIHPAIRDLFQELSRRPEFQQLLHALTKPGRDGGECSLSGLTTTAKAIYLVLMWQALERPLVVVTDGSRQAEQLTELVTTFFRLLVPESAAPPPQMIPSLDVLPTQRLSPHPEISAQRVTGLWRLARGAAPITITPVASAMLRTEDARFYSHLALELEAGEDVPIELLTEHLDSVGYQQREPVEMVGEYSVRGGIVDIFPAESKDPVRLELFGDTIESMRVFDVTSQRSICKTNHCVVLPLAEWPLEKKLLGEVAEKADLEFPPPPGEPFPGWEFLMPLLHPRSDSLLTLAENAHIVIDEPEQVRGAAERLWVRLEDPAKEPACAPELNVLRWEEFEKALSGKQRILLRELEIDTAEPKTPVAASVRSRPSMAFHGNVPVAVSEARNLVAAGHRVVFFATSSGELERLADIFQEYSLPYQVGTDTSQSTSQYLAERASVAGSFSNTFLVKGTVRRGVILPDTKLTLFGAEDLFETSEMVARPAAPSSRMGAFAADISDLKPGDYVVHVTHGVGKFTGVREIVQGERKGDFMLLEYAGDSKLYVPLTRLDLVQKYRSAGDAKPAVDRLGGATWRRTKSRVKAKMRDMADELLKLYAQRRMAEGHAFSSDSNWQREFDDSFEYTETKDQANAIKEIKEDMERPQPMDRLLCGDVGYGKTEVAMRAAFKALGDGKQVAVLAPTTVLCFQHYETFRSRFAPFPVNIEMVSRFRTPKETRAVLADLAAGKLDILIGTHRLLSKDVEFRDLGLLVVDEEQRFGVRHKERLKEIRKNVDVLTMSATPIPRTLHMSLLGLRDLSVIETPPKDRLAIQTSVTHFNRDLIKIAIEQELARGGQVYFVHNRVETIWERAASIQELLPECRISVGHGQMGEAALEKVLMGFMRHECDVFVCTTIVENGLDIPLANTIIIENAERYGLSELYQLRGRVGRSNRRAYAYLLIPEDTELSEVARKRLAALREFSDLGAGFKIAALDLELRGAGNLLGGEQHGHINMVGFDMYMKLLEQAVQELKGEEVPLEIHSSLNLGLDIRIPPEYIGDEHQRLRVYKRIADAADGGQAGQILEELEDRYGPAPDVVRNLLRFSTLKSTAEKIGVESIERRQGMVNIKFHQASRIDPNLLMALIEAEKGAQFTPAGVLRVPVDGKAGADGLLEGVRGCLERLWQGESE